MVNPLKQNISPHSAGRYGQSAKRSTQHHHLANAGKSGFQAERIGALRALLSVRSQEMLAVEIWRETHFLSNEEKEKWMEDYVERETAGARKRVEEAEAAVQQGQEDMTRAIIAGMTSREPEKTF